MKEELDQPITLKELGEALMDLANDKSSGLDGIPADFWKVFWPKIKDFYFEVIQECIKEGKLFMTAREGIISLLEKSGQDTMRLKHWRPLTLLNSDNKIYSKALAKRLQKMQHSLINPEQTGFVKQRQLSTNIIKIMEILNHCDSEGIDRALIGFDFLKAFDTVEWSSIFHALQVFGFGLKYIEMVKLLFTNPKICAYNNGYLSEFIYPTRGCRQGCCYLPIIFTFVVELLGLAIRQDENIEGIQIGEVNSNLDNSQMIYGHPSKPENRT